MCEKLSSIFICLVLPFINTPLIIILTLLIIALYSCLWIVLYVSIIYAIITFLVYITGMLVIFTFILVITPNFVTRFSYWWIILLLAMQFQTELIYSFKSNPEYDLTAIFKNFPVFFLMVYLLLQCIVVVSNVCFKPGQPLRSGYNLKKILALEVEFSLYDFLALE